MLALVLEHVDGGWKTSLGETVPELHTRCELVCRRFPGSYSFCWLPREWDGLLPHRASATKKNRGAHD